MASEPTMLDPYEARRVNLAAGALSGPIWEKVERAYAKGQTLDEAKQSVLDREIAALSATTDDGVIERIVQMVMQTQMAGLRPLARQKHRAAVLERLLAPHREAGKAAPSRLELWLYRRFGLVPGRLKAFWAARGERLGRVL